MGATKKSLENHEVVLFDLNKDEKKEERYKKEKLYI